MTLSLYLFSIPFQRRFILKWLNNLVLFFRGLMFLATTTFYLYLFFEITLFPIVLIILGYGYTQERIGASTLLLIYTLTASLSFLVYITIKVEGSENSPCLIILSFLPFLVKLPLVGLHLWLPKAHVERPTLGSILLAGVILKLGRYGVYFISKDSTLDLSSYLLFSLVLVSFITATQRDGKSLIAYRRIGHINIGVVLLIRERRIRCRGFILINFFHAFISGLIFYLVGIIFYFSSSRILYLLKGFRSFLLLSVTLIVIARNIGAPPIIRWLGEVITITSIFLSTPLASISLILYLLFSGYFSVYFFTSTSLTTAPLNSYNPNLITTSLFLFFITLIIPLRLWL